MKRLSELKPGEKAQIVKIEEDSILRKRLIELGIREGKEVYMRRDAPMGDPIEISLMGFNMSLRRSEAEYVLIDQVEELGDGKQKIRVALAGNPNCGKTTLFNLLTGSRQHVGNWPGVTVEKKEGHFIFKGMEIELIDLPGIYSLSPNTIEEIVARNFIIEEKPDLIINILDGTTLERSLYLTTQLIDTGANMILAINMLDEVQQKGIQIYVKAIEERLSMPIVQISAKKEIGTKDLLYRILDSTKPNGKEKIRINYGEDFENSIQEVECAVNCAGEIADLAETRWTAIQLLTADKEVMKKADKSKYWEDLSQVVQKNRKNLVGLYGSDLDMVVTEKRFGFVLGIIRECVTIKKFDYSKVDTTEAIDNVLLNKYFSFPIFALILWATFQLTFLAGGFFSGFITKGVKILGDWLIHYMPAGMLKDLLIGGVVNGVGGILVFLPQILLLFLIIAILEDSGYMARVAFIMDRLMHFLGVHGKSFISLFMGIGCNVPGIMAARTLENEEDRKVTVLINPFMSCSARLPIYVLIAGIFFGKAAGTVIFSLYFLGVLVAIFTAKILKVLFFRKKSPPFVMELPPYRMPSAKSLLIHMWERGSIFIRKMGGVILVGSIIIWALGYFPRTTNYSAHIKDLESQQFIVKDAASLDNIKFEIESAKQSEQLENSFIGMMGRTIEPFFKPLGFGWKEGVALITGVVGKEVVVSTMSVLYASGKESPDRLKSEMTAGGMTPVSAFGFLVFVLLYIPCLATIAAVMKETNSMKWTAFSIFYGIAVGYALSFLVHVIGKLIFA